MADKKISELDAITGADTAADDFFVVVDTSGSVTKKISRAELNNAIEQDVLSTVDINGGTIDNAVIGGTTAAAGSFTNVTVSGTVDGRDVASDGTKLDGIEASADVTDATNVAAAGALMTTASGIDVTGGIDFSSGILASNGSVQFVMDKDNNGGEVFAWGHNASNATTNELMRLTSAGSLGIGTVPNAASKLHVSGGRSYFASNSNAFATYLRYNDTTAGVFVGSPAANEFRVSASSGALRLNVDAEGRLTSSGTGSGVIGIFKTTANSGTGLYINSQTTNQIDLVGYDGSAANAVNIRSGGATGSGLTVNTSNNVGIGTSAPSTILDVEGANINFASSENGILNVFSNDATAVNKGGSISLGGNSESGSLGFAMIKGAKESTDAGYLAFGTRTAAANSTERLRITSAGDVGIGRTDPQNIVGNSGGGLVIRSGASRAGTTSLFAVQDSSGNNSFLQLHNGQTTFSTGAAGSKVEAFKIADGGFITHTRASGAAQSMVGFKNGANFVGEIRTSTTATSYITSSDYRLKENVTAITSATDRLNQLNPVRFNFIADADTTVDGFLAHEVATVIPEAISGEKDEVDADGNAVMQGIDQSKLVPLLTAALQEALTKIDQLETRITALEV